MVVRPPSALPGAKLAWPSARSTRGLGHVRFSSSPSAGRRARGHEVLAADHLAGFLEDAVAPRRPSGRTRAHRGIRGDAAVPSEPPQIVPTMSSSAASALEPAPAAAASLTTHAPVDRATRAARFLDPDRSTGRPLAAIVRARRRAIEASHPSDTSSTPPTLGCVRASHHAQRVVVGIAAGEADQMHIVVPERRIDLAGDVVRTLDQIGNDDHVADALSAIGAQRSRSASCRQRCR